MHPLVPALTPPVAVCDTVAAYLFGLDGACQQQLGRMYHMDDELERKQLGDEERRA